MKKSFFFWFIVSILITIFFRVAILKSSPRSYIKMEEKAYKELVYILHHQKNEDKINYFKKFTSIENENKDGLIFSWYYILKTGDTAIIDIEVRKQIKFWQDEPFEVRMNEKWGYLHKSEKNILYVLPKKFRNDNINIEKLVPNENIDRFFGDNDSIKLLMPYLKLFSLVKDGYFNVLARYYDYTVVAFFEPIAVIPENGKTIKTLTAKIFVNKKMEILIIPFDAPLELWDNYNRY
jgi:hypothetical protein